MGMPEVLDVTIVPGRRTVSICLEQRALDVELLHDGFENPVDRGEAANVRVEPPRRDQCGRVR